MKYTLRRFFNYINRLVSNSLPADVDMWKQEYDGACREIMSLQEQLKEAEREIADLNAELRNAHF